MATEVCDAAELLATGLALLSEEPRRSSGSPKGICELCWGNRPIPPLLQPGTEPAFAWCTYSSCHTALQLEALRHCCETRLAVSAALLRITSLWQNAAIPFSLLLQLFCSENSEWSSSQCAAVPLPSGGRVDQMAPDGFSMNHTASGTNIPIT